MSKNKKKWKTKNNRIQVKEIQCNKNNHIENLKNKIEYWAYWNRESILSHTFRWFKLIFIHWLRAIFFQYI